MGMNYERQDFNSYIDSPEFVTGTDLLIGEIAEADMSLLEGICESTPPPAAQVALNGRRLDPSKLLRRCGEW